MDSCRYIWIQHMQGRLGHTAAYDLSPLEAHKLLAKLIIAFCSDKSKNFERGFLVVVIHECIMHADFISPTR